MATTKKRATATASRKMATASARKKAMIVDEGAKGGFTIIEVVLVLAIAGLIFLMVFLALPALQRSQKDSQRQRDVGNVTAQIQKYQQNNNGRLPADGSTPAVPDADDVDLDTQWPCKSGAAGTNTAVCFIRNYMNGATSTRNEWVDPTGYSYGLAFETLSSGGEKVLGNSDFNDHMVYVEKHARCDGEKAVYSSNARDFAVMYKLEGSGTYCE